MITKVQNTNESIIFDLNIIKIKFDNFTLNHNQHHMRIIILTLSVVISQYCSAQKSNWQLSKNKNGIKVYTRVPKGTKIKEFKALTTINASVDKIEGEIRNVSSHAEWIKDIIMPSILKSINSNEMYSYYQLKVPFPFDNRDMVLHCTMTKENGTFTMIEKGFPKYIESKKGVVRMSISEGMWILTPNSDGKTNVHYQFLGSPDGAIPVWLTNMMVVDGPYETLLDLKDRVE